MKELLTVLAIGTVLLVMGIMNIKGNISTLHRYHRSRVKEEDVPVFGKLVGTGTIICSASLITFGILHYLSEILVISSFSIVGTIIMIPGLIVGVAFMLYAMIKYNKGIF